MFDLTGKTAVVTGASGGIGRAIALALATRGAFVVLSGTRAAVLDQVAREIEGKGGQALAVTADLGTGGGAEGLIQAATAARGGVDILVSNAGVTRDGLILRMSEADWEHVLMVNLTAAFRLIRAVLRPMMKQRWGRLIGVSSIVGQTGNAGQANYAAAKAGMAGLFKTVAQEVASRGITANCVAPGFIETDMTEGLADARRQVILAAIPAARLGTPDDVAQAVLYLASSEAAYITGQTLHINGGLSMP
jgi:3-oxoacyl-[acyl-carrier protein] reductase